MKKIAIFGSGGFGIEIYFMIIDLIKNDNSFNYHFIGFFDDKIIPTSYAPYLGGINELNAFSDELNVVIGIGNPRILKIVTDKISNKNIIFPNIIHPSCKFIGEDTFSIGKGNIILTGCTISCNVGIGNFNIMNTNVILGHDVKAGSYNVFSPNTLISGNINIGNQNFFGFNSGVIQGRKIGNNNVIGAGSTLLRNINNEGTYIGVPAQKIKI